MIEIILGPEWRTSTVSRFAMSVKLFGASRTSKTMHRTNIIFKSGRGPLTKARSATKSTSTCHYNELKRMSVGCICFISHICEYICDSLTYLTFVNFVHNNMTDIIQLLVVYQSAQNDPGGTKQYPCFATAFNFHANLITNKFTNRFVPPFF